MAPLLFLLALLLFLLLGRRRRNGEPPLIKGWVPFLGNALPFRQNTHRFLEEQRRKNGDVFTVLIAGKYMTFIMDPLLYPSIIKHGRQLDFHEFTKKVPPLVFGYTELSAFPGLSEQLHRAYQFLQGDSLTPLTESMMGNLMLLFRQDHLDPGRGWRTGTLYEFCSSVMFEATFLTIYGRPQSGSRHQHMDQLLKDFLQFDAMFPYLIAEVPIWLLGRTKTVRQKLISHFLPQRLSRWSDRCRFVQTRQELFNQYDQLRDEDQAAQHFTVLWASVSNTLPATFWATYDLVAHPEALQVVRQEILDVLRASGMEFSPNRDLTLSRDQLDQMVFLESSIKESLRLSSASMNIRLAQEDFSLRLDSERSMAVRKGDIITLYPQSMHLDPEIYEDPQTFRFDRFVEDGREKTDFRKAGQKLKYFLMPFGSGSTKCPGRYFAINELKQFVCLLLLYLDLQLEDGQTRPPMDKSRVGLGIQQPASPVGFRYRLRAE